MTDTCIKIFSCTFNQAKHKTLLCHHLTSELIDNVVWNISVDNLQSQGDMNGFYYDEQNIIIRLREEFERRLLNKLGTTFLESPPKCVNSSRKTSTFTTSGGNPWVFVLMLEKKCNGC